MRRLLSLTSTDGKTPEEVRQEVIEAYARDQAATAKSRETRTGPFPEEGASVVSSRSDSDETLHGEDEP